jgi:hypothetical protein
LSLIVGIAMERITINCGRVYITKHPLSLLSDATMFEALMDLFIALYYKAWHHPRPLVAILEDDS